jgi:benzoate 4-monooxygenase
MLSALIFSTAGIIISSGLVYIFYEIFLHPLAKFPGPLLASISGWWRVYHELKGDLPQTLDQLHRKYGPFIRVAPAEIDTIDPEFVDVVLKGGRTFVKSSYYDGSGGIKPNVFSSRDESFHAMRRRQMSHGFSTATFTKMEYLFNRHASVMIHKLDIYAETGKPFDLNTIFKFYSQDTNSELSFSKQYHLQEQGDLIKLPPMNLYSTVAKCYGYIPGLRPVVEKYGPHLPYLSWLLRSRGLLIKDAVIYSKMEFEKRRLKHAEKTFDDDDERRINLLTSMVMAKDPETGKQLEVIDIAGEAMSFIVAGSHSTAATMGFLFAVLLANPAMMRNVQDEIHANILIDQTALSSKDEDEINLPPFAGLENGLPYLNAVIKEVFRVYPTVNHPFGRVIPSTQTVVGGRELPPGTIISSVPYAFHRNPDLWGKDAESFRPERWLTKEGRSKERYLIHFGQGHRACIGRNMALITIWKGVVGILKRYDIYACDENGNKKQIHEIRMNGRGFADLQEPLLTMFVKKSSP